MVRTKDNAGVKVGSKAPRKIPPSQSSSEQKSKYSGGSNPYCPRETPAWQKPITEFFPSSSTKVKIETVTSATVTASGSNFLNGNNVEMESNDNASMGWDNYRQGKAKLDNQGETSRVAVQEDQEVVLKKVWNDDG